MKNKTIGCVHITNAGGKRANVNDGVRSLCTTVTVRARTHKHVRGATLCTEELDLKICDIILAKTLIGRLFDLI